MIIRKTDRTVIEVLESADAELLLNYHVQNKHHLAPWEPKRTANFFTLDNFKAMLSANQRSFREKTALKFSALSPDRSEIIAVCNFTNIVFGSFQACNLGFSIAEKNQGQGLMTEVLNSATAYVFDELDLHRIMANYLPENTRSAAVLEKLGFEQEGYAKSYLRIAGKWQDHVLTSKINPGH